MRRHTRARPCIWLGVLLAIVPGGCGEAAAPDLPDITLNLAVAPVPPVVGPATVTITLQGADGQPVAGAEIELEGNMSHAGMVPIFATAREVAPGRYVADLELSMAGDWFILVDATLPDGRSLEQKIDLPGVVMP